MKQTYQEFIDEILSTRGRFACGEEYHERHHIVPRCMGGEDEPNNLIDLYGREHFVAHKLLAEENPDNIKLVYAWWMMSTIRAGKQDRYELTPEEYEEVRIALHESMKGHIVSEETRRKIGKVHKGKIMSVESRLKMSLSRKGRITTEETRKKISEANKNMSEETRQKLREINQGKTIPTEARQKMTEAKKDKMRGVYCFELHLTFRSINEAGRVTGVRASSISNCCNGIAKSAGTHQETGEKLHWCFAEKINQKEGIDYE